MEVHPIENEIGIQIYITQIPGIGGKLRTKIEDFLVEEITTTGEILKSQNLSKIHPKNDLNFDNLPTNLSSYNLVLEKYNYETFSAIERIASSLKIPYRNIGYAGLKDKRAITCQLISISRIDPRELLNFEVQGIYLNRIRPGKPIKLGELRGNRFKITIRQLDALYDQINNKINAILEQITHSQLPNYYGHQRFGVLRPISHKVGRELLFDDFEKALQIYLTANFPQERKEIRELRTALNESWPEPNVSLPKEFYYENKIIQYLKTNNNFKQIFKKIFPIRFRLLFVHAYQSYLFNRLLSARIKDQIPLNQAILGDYVAIMAQDSLPSHVIYEVTSNNQSSLNKTILKNRAVVMAPLFGFDLEYSRHPLAERISQILYEEKIELSQFKSTHDAKLYLKSIYRPISFQPKDLNLKIDSIESHDLSLVLSFSLNKGIYATTFLREFMKTNPLNY